MNLDRLDVGCGANQFKTIPRGNVNIDIQKPKNAIRREPEPANGAMVRNLGRYGRGKEGPGLPGGWDPPLLAR